MLTNGDCSRTEDENDAQSNFKKNKIASNRFSNLLIEMCIFNSILAQVFQVAKREKTNKSD